MAGKTNTNRRTANGRGRGSAGGPRNECQIVEDLIDTAFTQLRSREISVTELIKLMQVRKELDSKNIKEIEVRWVETFEKDDAQ